MPVGFLGTFDDCLHEAKPLASNLPLPSFHSYGCWQVTWDTKSRPTIEGAPGAPVESIRSGIEIGMGNDALLRSAHRGDVWLKLLCRWLGSRLPDVGSIKYCCRGNLERQLLEIGAASLTIKPSAQTRL